MSLLCRVFDHKWQFASGDSCEEVCSRCGAKADRTIHDLGDWAYMTDGSCKQIRVCSRCKFKEDRTAHMFGGWMYVIDGSCDQTRAGSRCGAQESRTMHDWGPCEPEWSGDTHRRSCSRDGAEQSESHNWRPWTGTPNYQSVSQGETEFSNWEEVSGSICDTCGATRIESCVPCRDERPQGKIW